MTDRRLKINFVRHAKYTFFLTETGSWNIFRAVTTVTAVHITRLIHTYLVGKVQSFHIAAIGAYTDQHILECVIVKLWTSYSRLRPAHDGA